MTISKSKLKGRMLAIFREIEKSGKELIVTDFDRPVLKISPYNSPLSVEEAFAGLDGKVEYGEDPASPTLGEWPEP